MPHQDNRQMLAIRVPFGFQCGGPMLVPTTAGFNRLELLMLNPVSGTEGIIGATDGSGSGSATVAIDELPGFRRRFFSGQTLANDAPKMLFGPNPVSIRNMLDEYPTVAFHDGPAVDALPIPINFDLRGQAGKSVPDRFRPASVVNQLLCIGQIGVGRNQQETGKKSVRERHGCILAVNAVNKTRSYDFILQQICIT